MAADRQRRIVFLGPPNSRAKGPRQRCWPRLSGYRRSRPEKCCAQAVESGSALGARVKDILAAGRLVDDGTMADVVRGRLAQDDAGEGFLLDGYPRTGPQSETLAEILDESGGQLDDVVLIDAPTEVLVARGLARGREDDSEEVIRQRLEVYRNQTALLVALYEARGLLRGSTAISRSRKSNGKFGWRSMRRREAQTMRVVLKTPGEIELMDDANRIVHQVLDGIAERIRPGVTTGELDRFAEGVIREAGGVPAFLNYKGFPATLCTALNDVIVHGIPDERPLGEGDIIGLDCGVFYKGYCGDAARTYAVGEVSEKAARLLRATQEALDLAVEAIAARRPAARHRLRSRAAREELRILGRARVRRSRGGHGAPRGSAGAELRR